LSLFPPQHVAMLVPDAAAKLDDTSPSRSRFHYLIHSGFLSLLRHFFFAAKCQSLLIELTFITSDKTAFLQPFMPIFYRFFDTLI